MKRENYKAIFNKVASLFIIVLLSIVFFIMMFSYSYRSLYNNTLSIDFNGYQYITDNHNVDFIKSNTIQNIISDMLNFKKNSIFFKEEAITSSWVLEQIDLNLNQIKKELNFNEDDTQLRNVIFNEINSIFLMMTSNLTEEGNFYINFLILISTNEAINVCIIIFSFLLLLLILKDDNFKWVKNISRIFLLVTISYFLSFLIFKGFFTYLVKFSSFDVRLVFLKSILDVVFKNEIIICGVMFLFCFIYMIIYLIINNSMKRVIKSNG